MTALNKPVRRVAQVREMPHGFRDRLVVTLYPGGIVSVREVRRREAVEFDLSKLYVSALITRSLARRITRRGKMAIKRART